VEVMDVSECALALDDVVLRVLVLDDVDMLDVGL